ncbi:Nitroreductase-like protein [Trametes gibbosa]|nr:Nitroreductase-like protein [Trametes gibbosa]
MADITVRPRIQRTHRQRAPSHPLVSHCTSSLVDSRSTSRPSKMLRIRAATYKAFCGANLSRSLFVPLFSHLRLSCSRPSTVHPRRRTNMTGSAVFLDAVKARRSLYAIRSESTISDVKIKEIIATAIKHAPSTFNIQGSRPVLLLSDEHRKLWDLALDVLKGVVPAEQLPATEVKIKGFAAGHGTLLFFEDKDCVTSLQTCFPIYHERFPTFNEHANAILQYIVWTVLEAEGLGASLQHYNPLITPQLIST